jgi:hypothetical protein
VNSQSLEKGRFGALAGIATKLVSSEKNSSFPAID